MPQARILLNAVPGANDDLPINTLVQLSNQNLGGELSYLWTVMDQPNGTADAISNTVIQNPTITPKKEGTYLIKLVVNLGLPTEQEDSVIIGVRQLKTRERVPAGGETTQDSKSEGWSVAMNSLLRRIDTLLSDSAVMVGINNSGGSIAKGTVVRCTSLPTIKTGLPGQEVVPGFVVAHATTLGEVDELLAIVEGTADGTTPVPDQGIMKVRHFGLPRNQDGTPQTFAGAPAVGDTVYLSNTGVPALTPGTTRRQIGSVAAAGGGVYSIMFDGVGGADITPINAPYVVYGNPGTLTNAFRVDGANFSSVSGGVPWKIGTADDATVTFQLRRHDNTGLSIQQWLDESNATLLEVRNDGTISSDQFAIYFASLGTKIASIAQPFGGISSFSVFSPDASTTLALVVPNAGNPVVGTTTNSDLQFGTVGVVKWKVQATGELVAVGPQRAIQNVLDPVNAQDAATRNYVDDVAPAPNLVINGHMSFWQRGVGPFDSTFNVNTLAADRKFVADRWVAVLQAGTALSATDTVASSQVSVSEASADYALRLRYKTNNTHASGVSFIWAAQEIDRGFIKQCRGKKLSVSLRWSKGSSMADAGRIQIITNNNDQHQAFGGAPNGAAYWTFNNTQYGNGAPADPGSHPIYQAYAGGVTILDATVANGSIGASPAFTTATATTSAVVPGDATGMVILIGRALNNSTADANAFLDITEVDLVIGTTPPITFNPAGGSLADDLRLAQQYLEKSYQPVTAPGTATSSGAVALNKGNSYIGWVPFKVSKSSALTTGGDAVATTRLAIWPSVAALTQGNVRNVTAAANQVGTVGNMNDYGFQLTNAAGAAVSDTIEFHYAADWEL